MEGFKPSSKKMNLSYPEYPGLSILAKGMTIGNLQRISGMRMTAKEQDAEKVDFMFKFFASRVLTWNVLHPEVELDEDAPDDWDGSCPICGLMEGAPLPTTAQAMYCLDMGFILGIIFGWVAAIASAANPKERNSSDGAMNSHMEEVMSRLEELQNQSTLPMLS